MSDPILGDRTIGLTQQALDGLSQRQELIGRNLANVDTPGYQAATVDFETALRAQTRRLAAGPLRLSATHAHHLAAPSDAVLTQTLARRGGTARADGNNVDPDLELTEMAQTGIQYQALSQLVSKKLLLLKSIATGR